MKYADYQPTGFDPCGLSLPDRQDWLVLPVSRNRDTGDPLTLSNFEMALEALGGESETVEIHRFGHWGVGWFEIILAHPDRETEVDEIEGALADYPVLNDEHFSELEWEMKYEAWENEGMRERIRLCDKAGVSIFAARRDEIPEDVDQFIELY